MIRFQALMLGLVLVLVAPVASTFVDPPVLVPEHPVAGETVSISIRFGICDGWIDLPGYPQITRNGKSLRILLAATHASNSSWCNVPIGTGTVPVGAFGPGEYVLQVDRVYENLLDEEIVETLGFLPFTVTGAPSVVPTLDQYFRALLLFVILIFSLLALRHRHVSLLLLLTLVPLGLCAQTASDGFVIALLLDESAGAPSPQSVVNYYTTVPRTGKPPLASLAAGNPQTVVYLLPLRASGDFATFLASHPDSTRARLERYLVAPYPAGAEISAALVLANVSMIDRRSARL